MSEPELNVELVQRTLAAIEANPQQWSQRACFIQQDYPRPGFTACFGGWGLAVHQGVDIARVEFDGCGPWNSARDLFGLSQLQAYRVFGFMSSSSSKPEPTFAELCERVRQETGFRYEPTADPAASRGG